eukprot:NODE_6144_length_600_cov_28.214156_g5738_i0.p1 GENE.NODE_6144_length_600_cov_28.214156_g5738_i0~~NODE_6144_length_600_cov_28.214156_g5738_i0.p1  ORF type:complete len:122 (-),score=23.83 NODE_6144_length_600_cov_28.214156_g5738_i0:120-485(-)
MPRKSKRERSATYHKFLVQKDNRQVLKRDQRRQEQSGLRARKRKRREELDLDVPSAKRPRFTVSPTGEPELPPLPSHLKGTLATRRRKKRNFHVHPSKADYKQSKKRERKLRRMKEKALGV